MNKLNEWLASNSITQGRFASRIGVHQSVLSRYCSGARTPRLTIAARIERETGGAVPISIWADEREDEAGTAA